MTKINYFATPEEMQTAAGRMFADAVAPSEEQKDENNQPYGDDTWHDNNTGVDGGGR